MKISVWFLVLILALSGSTFAQGSGDKDNSNNSASKESLKPIDVQTYGWGWHSWNAYSYEGAPLQNIQQFKDIIQPLGDEKANSMLRSADDKTAVGTGLILGGIALSTGALVNLLVQVGNTDSPVDQFGDTPFPNVGLFTLLFTAGTGAWVGGMLLQGDSMIDTTNAANRYNYVVKGEKNLSLGSMPGSPLGADLTLQF